MNNFFITHNSLGYMGPAVLALFFSLSILFRQFKSKKFQKSIISFALYFFFHSVYNILNFIGFSWYTPSSQYVWYAESVISIVIVFLLYFAYTYPERRFEREKRIVIVLFAFLSLASAADYIYHAANSKVMLYGQTFGSEYFTKYVPLVTGLIYLWTVSIFIRKTIINEREEYQDKSILSCIFRPKNIRAKTARSFSIVVSMEILYSALIFSVMNMVDLGETMAVYASTTLLLVIYSFYIFIYLISAYQNVPFLYKLTGIPMVLILFVIITIGYVTMNFRSISYDEMNLTLIKHLDINEIIQNKNADIPVYYVCELSSEGDCAVFLNKSVKSRKNINMLLWNSLPSGHQIRNSLGVLTYKDIVPDKRYFSRYGNQNYLVYFRRKGVNLYGFGIPYVHFLQYMDKIGFYMLLIVSISMTILVMVLSFLNYIGIIAPLNSLISPDGKVFSSETELDRISKIVSQIKETARKKEGRESGYTLTDNVKAGLNEIIDYISNNYKNDISREGLASMINMDVDYVSKLFKIYTGIKINDFINRLRIEEACQMLNVTDKKIIDISMEVGFESLRTFNRAFTKIMSISPSQYKKKTQKQ